MTTQEIKDRMKAAIDAKESESIELDRQREQQYPAVKAERSRRMSKPDYRSDSEDGAWIRAEYRRLDNLCHQSIAAQRQANAFRDLYKFVFGEDL